MDAVTAGYCKDWMNGCCRYCAAAAAVGCMSHRSAALRTLRMHCVCGVQSCCTCTWQRLCFCAERTLRRLHVVVSQVVPGPDHHMLVLDYDIITPPNLQPKMLLLNAVDCSGLTDDVRLLQLLLQHGVREQQIERHRLDLEVSNDRGETALLAAVRKGRAEVGLGHMLFGALSCGPGL